MFTALEIKLLAGAAIVVALLLGLWAYDKHQRELGAAENKAEVAQTSMKLAQDNAAKSAQIIATQQGVIHDAQLQTSAARADAASAVAAGSALRVQLNAYVSSRRGPVYSPPAVGGAPTDDPIGLLATLLGRVDDAAGRYAAEADANWIGWSACTKSYDALSPK